LPSLALRDGSDPAFQLFEILGVNALCLRNACSPQARFGGRYYL
jgi:hypothetical protein